MKYLLFLFSLFLSFSCTSCTSTSKKLTFTSTSVTHKATVKTVTKKTAATTSVKALVHKAKIEKLRSVTFLPKKTVIDKAVKALVANKVVSIPETITTSAVAVAPSVKIQNVAPVTPKQSQTTVTPLLENVPVLEQSIPPFPETVIEGLKKKENYPLATGKIKISENINDEVGYGVTSDEVEDAIREGFLPEGSTLPERMTKDQADQWLVNITIPTYRSIVREIVKEKITLQEEIALTFFTQNQGRGNLKKLVDQPNRLNDGNHESIIKIMPLYYGQNRGLKKRGAWQVSIITGERGSGV